MSGDITEEYLKEMCLKYSDENETISKLVEELMDSETETFDPKVKKTLKLLNELNKLTNGSFFIDGLDVEDLRSLEKNRIGMSFQKLLISREFGPLIFILQYSGFQECLRLSSVCRTFHFTVRYVLEKKIVKVVTPDTPKFCFKFSDDPSNMYFHLNGGFGHIPYPRIRKVVFESDKKVLRLAPFFRKIFGIKEKSKKKIPVECLEHQIIMFGPRVIFTSNGKIGWISNWNHLKPFFEDSWSGQPWLSIPGIWKFKKNENKIMRYFYIDPKNPSRQPEGKWL